MGIDALLQVASTLVDRDRQQDEQRQDRQQSTPAPRGCHNLEPCGKCYCRFYWRPRSGAWRCAECDPPLVASIAAEWTHIEFDSLHDWIQRRTVQMVVEGFEDSEESALAMCVLMMPRHARAFRYGPEP